MHSPLMQLSPMFGLQTLKHFPQFLSSSCVLTQTPPHISSPKPMQSPVELMSVVPVSLLDEVSLVLLVDDVSLSDEVDVLSDEVDVDDDSEVDVLSEVDVDVDVDVSGVAVVSEVVGGSVDVRVAVDDMPFVLDIESVPVDDALIESLAVAAVVSSSPPPQANRVRPTSVDIMNGAAPWTWESDAEQKGQRISLSQT